jgi:hypothetical protein
MVLAMVALPSLPKIGRRPKRGPEIGEIETA